MERCLVCPAARALAGPPSTGPTVVCGVMQNDGKRADSIAGWGVFGQVMSVADNPQTIASFCAGPGMPSLSEEPHRPKAHYTSCPVWRAEKARVWEARARIAEPVEPEPPLSTVGQGARLEQHDAHDMQRAVAALDEIAGARR